jgi:hypothetical protein
MSATEASAPVPSKTIPFAQIVLPMVKGSHTSMDGRARATDDATRPAT